MNKYILKLIKEQFNIGNMDLNNIKLKRNINIFNKNFKHPYYYKILDSTVTKDEINELNSLVGVTATKDKDELIKIIEFYSDNYPECSLNWLDVSGITDMSWLFASIDYNGDISKWDTSNVTDMNNMFYFAEEFNLPIGEWNVSNVTDMRYMFWHTYKFNQPIGGWDVSNVTNMDGMFCFAKDFNQPIGKWNVSSVTDMNGMFWCAYKFNKSISKWNINDKTDIKYMFVNCPIKEKYKPEKCR